MNTGKASARNKFQFGCLALLHHSPRLLSALRTDESPRLPRFTHRYAVLLELIYATSRRRNPSGTDGDSCTHSRSPT